MASNIVKEYIDFSKKIWYIKCKPWLYNTALVNILYKGDDSLGIYLTNQYNVQILVYSF